MNSNHMSSIFSNSPEICLSMMILMVLLLVRMMSNNKHVKVILKALIDTSRTFSLQKCVECMKIREVVKY